jgi:hypothetical protein
MSLKEGRTEVGPEEPAGGRRYVAEAVCTDCDYDEYRRTTGVTGSFTRCPDCGGDLVIPRDAMS